MDSRHARAVEFVGEEWREDAMIGGMAEIDGEHVCGPFPDPNEPMGSCYTCPDCGLGYFYERITGWHLDSLFAGEALPRNDRRTA